LLNRYGRGGRLPRVSSRRALASMGAKNMVSGRAKILRANLCEIERGLFHISYLIDTGREGMNELPTYQIGTNAADAKQRVEEKAQRRGFDTVIWENPALPDFPDETAAPSALPQSTIDLMSCLGSSPPRATHVRD
jgi:hypothetical protein